MPGRVRSVGVWVVVLLLALCAAFALVVRAGEIRGAWVEAPLVPSADAGEGLAQPRPATGGVLPRVPLYFIENRGQLDPQVAYYVQGNHKTMYFTPQGVTFALHGAGNVRGGELSYEFPRVPSARWAVKLEFVGANTDVQPEGVDETGAVISYFKGQPEEWVTGAKACSGVVYRDLWPGIDLQYYGLVDKLKYQFAVGPGADPSHIRLAYHGATDVTVDQTGRLHVSTPVGGFEDDAPYAYQQDKNGERAEIGVSYEFLPSSHEYGFRVGDYDHTVPLILDPTVLNYCGYIGGSEDELGRDIAVDAWGNAYVTGSAYSTQATFPVAVGPDLTHNNQWDAFVAKVRADGSGLAYCGYIGGGAWDGAHGIAVDDLGRAYVTGQTFSSHATFPVTTGPDLTFNGDTDAFVAKVSADGTALIYCGYIGGQRMDEGWGIAVDRLGRAHVTGHTDSNDDTDAFPVLVGPDLTFNGDTDAFVAKVRADGSSLVYCGYIGGSEVDKAFSAAVDGSNMVYLTGYTQSDDGSFPEVVGPDLTHNGASDAYVAKVREDGTGLAYCGYIGGEHEDVGASIAVDDDGNAYVAGRTRSRADQGFPVLGGPDLTYNGGDRDAFVARVNSSGSGLDYCGYIGGSRYDAAYGIAVDAGGSAHVTGHTRSAEAEGFPVTAGPDLTHNGAFDAFVAKVRADGTWFDYCGYIGGSANEYAWGVAVDGDGNAYVGGHTRSDEHEGFPVTMGPDVTFNGGTDDVFVARVGENRAPTLGTLLPKVGSSPAGVTVYFTTTWKDADGWQDLKQCYFHIGASASVINNVTLLYNARKDKLWLLDDSGTTWTGGVAPGSANTLENSQAKVYCNLTSAHRTGDKLTVSWAIEFKMPYTGTKKLGLKCKDAHRAKAGGAWKGTWTIE